MQAASMTSNKTFLDKQVRWTGAICAKYFSNLPLVCLYHWTCQSFKQWNRLEDSPYILELSALYSQILFIDKLFCSIEHFNSIIDFRPTERLSFNHRTVLLKNISEKNGEIGRNRIFYLGSSLLLTSHIQAVGKHFLWRRLMMMMTVMTRMHSHLMAMATEQNLTQLRNFFHHPGGW